MEPPSRTTANAVTNATSASGSDISAPAIVVKMSRRLPRNSSVRSPPSMTATSTAAPTIGTASSAWNVVSATN